MGERCYTGHEDGVLGTKGCNNSPSGLISIIYMGIYHDALAHILGLSVQDNSQDQLCMSAQKTGEDISSTPKGWVINKDF